MCMLVWVAGGRRLGGLGWVCLVGMRRRADAWVGGETKYMNENKAALLIAVYAVWKNGFAKAKSFYT